MALTALTKHDQEYCKKLSDTVCQGAEEGETARELLHSPRLSASC